MDWNAIIQPTLVLDEERCKNNISRMAEKARSNDVLFRPHFKTHQSRKIAQYFREAGISRITVSSVEMASYFANDNWQNITIAFPVNIREISEINALAKRIRLNLLVEDPGVTYQLGKLLASEIGVFIKIDVGTHRTGITPEDHGKLESLVKTIQGLEKVKLKGFLAHPGHSYAARNVEEMQAIHENTQAILSRIRKQYRSHFSNLILSIGDTPTCSMLDELPGIGEIRPGNFVFYDLVQAQIGSCSLDEIAVMMCCPVVAKHHDRQELVVHGGGIHFSKDVLTLPDGSKSYGRFVPIVEDGWRPGDDQSHLHAMSQEHGIVKCSHEVFNRYRPGDLLGFLPVHSCMTADCMGGYTNLNGEHIDHMKAHVNHLA